MNAVHAIMWIDDANDRHYYAVPSAAFDGDLDMLVTFWIEQCGPHHKSLPKWVFFECDNRQHLFAPADQWGVDITDVRQRFSVKS